jgi:hypothetical protein
MHKKIYFECETPFFVSSSGKSTDKIKPQILTGAFTSPDLVRRLSREERAVRISDRGPAEDLLDHLLAVRQHRHFHGGKEARSRFYESASAITYG